MANASTVSPTAASGYRPAAGRAARRSAHAPTKPTASPSAAPATSSYPISSASCHHGSPCPAPVDSSETSSTTGASLMPDSASRIAASRRRTGIRRSVENTAAASVEESTAP